MPKYLFINSCVDGERPVGSPCSSIQPIEHHRSDQFQIVCFHSDRSRLADEIQPQMDLDRARASLDKPFEPAQRPGANPHPASRLNPRSQLDLVIRLEGQQDVVELPLEKGLIGNGQQIRHIIALIHQLPLRRQYSQEQIAWEQRLVERHNLAAVFVHRLHRGQRHRQPFARAVSRQLFLASRASMRHKPIQVHTMRLQNGPEPRARRKGKERLPQRPLASRAIHP